MKLGKLEERSTGYIEKRVDVLLAVDVLTMAYKNLYDTAIIISQDADFVPVVKAVKDLGKHSRERFCEKRMGAGK